MTTGPTFYRAATCQGCRYLSRFAFDVIVPGEDPRLLSIFREERFYCKDQKREVGGTALVTPDWCRFLYD